MDWGAAAREKNGANNLENMTVTTQILNRFHNPIELNNRQKRPFRARAWRVREKIHQGTLDRKGSFRDGSAGGI
jgi:hypothetical protein